MASAKNPYGLWVVTSKPANSRIKPKIIALVETNEKGIQKWMHTNGHRPERCSYKLLPEVEYFDPVDDLNGMLATGGVRVSNPKPKKTAKSSTAAGVLTATVRTTASGHCTGSGLKIPKSNLKAAKPGSWYGMKSTCQVCGREMTANGDRWRGYTMRKHKP